jgi:hypothetical protein
VTIRAISTTKMQETPHKDDLPLTDEELDKLLDDVEAEIEAQTPEERARSKKEADAWFANDPELAAAMNSLNELFGPPKVTNKEVDAASRYWIPGGIPEHLQIALSIPGEKPESPMAHSGRLEGLLARLAREHEEEYGEGSVLQAALGIAPDANLRYADSDMEPDAVVDLLMVSDHLQLGWVHQIETGNRDQELQDTCHEWGFVHRLSALVRLP